MPDPCPLTSEPHVGEEYTQETAQLVLATVLKGGIVLLPSGLPTLSAKLHLVAEPEAAGLVFAVLYGKSVNTTLWIFVINTIVHLFVEVHQVFPIEVNRHKEEAGVAPPCTVWCPSQLFVQLELLHVEHHRLVLSPAFHLAQHITYVEHGVTASQLQEVRASAQGLRPFQGQLYHQVLIVSLALGIVKAVVFACAILQMWGG